MSFESRTVSAGLRVMCSGSEILDARVGVSVEGRQGVALAAGGGHGLQLGGSSAQTPRCSLQYRIEDCLFLLKSETYQIIRFYRSCFLLYRRSANLLNMLAALEGGEELKLQIVLLKTAWAAFVWTCKTQQLNASIVRRGEYANSKHISHQKAFQACHRSDMKDGKSGAQGRPVLRERGPGHCALKGAGRERAHP